MLERAKACLQSGARETLRCVNAPHRSKRMLHSTFWQHGAGDLILPPWASGMFSMLDNLPLKAYGDSARGGKSGVVPKRKERPGVGTWAAPQDGVFLDFLYPPQALALLHSSSRQSPERWEKRNARRLPDGFVQASRGYASRARSRRVQAKEDYIEGLNQLAEGKQDVSRGTDEAEELLARFNRDDKEMPLGFRRENVAEEARPAQVDDDLDSMFADSPGDLAEAQSDTMHRLRSMLATGRRVDSRTDLDKRLAFTQRVLKTYDSLDETSKADTRLKSELLDWLSGQHNSQADTRCSELYNTTTPDQRTLSIYQAALSVFLRRGLHVQAVKLHREALKNITNGDQVTKSFFAYAIRENRWQLAINVEAQYRLQGFRGEAGDKLFWLHVSEIPHLILKATALEGHLSALRKARTDNDQVRRFCARFFMEALVQEFETRDSTKAEPSFADATAHSDGIPKATIGRLLDHLTYIGSEAHNFYQNIIVSMVEQKHPSYAYPRLHRVVSYAYLALRSTEKTVSTTVLFALLKKLTRYWGALRKQAELHHSITVATLLTDWQRFHGVIDKAALQHLLAWHASTGSSDLFAHWLEYYRKRYPGYHHTKDILISTIYLHARRMDLAQAKEAFADALKLTAEHEHELPLVCWNVMIHAHSRVDDLEGGLETLQSLVDKGVRPDEYSFHPVMQMLAERGDVEGVKDLLAQYDALADKKWEAAFYGSLLTAHVNCGEIEEAEAVLRQAMREVKQGTVRGSLTGSFNIVLTAHAMRRDIDKTMHTYKWMQKEGIRQDPETYAALMQALTAYRQTSSAWQLLNVVMRREQVQPTAFHYAIVMAGYVNQNLPDDALRVHHDMKEHNIKPSAGLTAVLLKARALKEHKLKTQQPLKQHAEPLSNTINALKTLLENRHGSNVAAHQPQHGRGLDRASGVPTGYVNFLIYIHGKRKCFDAVKELYQQYVDAANQSAEGDFQPPVELLGALMSAYLRAGEHEEVERCWQLAKAQADSLVRRVPVPQLKPAGTVDDDESAGDILQLRPPRQDDAQEVGFSVHERSNDHSPGAEDVSPPSEAKQALETTDDYRPPTPKPVPSRQHILTRPFRFYMLSLFHQRRLPDILSTIAALFGQGYTLDNRAWNVFIELLCRGNPPLVLLAFTLTERFLIPHFPGWAPISPTRPYSPVPGAKAEGLQYIRARYLRPGQLMPQYRTLVRLGAALLLLRRLEASGKRGMMDEREMKGMERYVGTMKEVRKQAPRTVYVVQTMPAVDDRLQNKLLRRS